MYYLLFSDNLTTTIDSNSNIIYQGSILNESKSNVIGEYFISRNDDAGVGQVELNLYDLTSEEPIPLDLNKLNGMDLKDYLRNRLSKFTGTSGINYMII